MNTAYNPDGSFTMLLGTKSLDKVVFWIETKKAGPWWWPKIEYYVVSDLASVGPFKTHDEAYEVYQVAQYGVAKL